VVRPLFFGVMCGVLGYAGYYGWSWYRNQKGVTAPVPSVQVTASPAPARTPAPVATVIPKPRPTHRPAPTPAPKRTPKAAQKPVKKSPQPLLGAVTIFPDGPFATVYLDGKRLGDTPIMKSQVPIGVHRLRFENEKLGLENEISVEVEKGKELRLKEIWKENTSP
jgi:serine/threonine-protein kinase